MKSGYETHVEEFRKLLRNRPSLMKRYLSEELNLQLRSRNKTQYISDRDGKIIEIEIVHQQIQDDPRLQREVYNIWMSTYH